MPRCLNRSTPLTVRGLNVILLLTFAAMSGPEGLKASENLDGESQAKKSQIVIGVGGLPSSLDPGDVHSEGDFGLLRNIFEPLVALDAWGELESLLADSWSSSSSREWIFNLKKDIRFHDGSLMTCSDVKRCIEGTMGNERIFLPNIVSVRCVDPLTLEINFERPDSTIPYALAMVLVYKVDKDSTSSTYVGTGPYRVERFDPAGHLELSAFDGYWRGRPPIRKGVFVIEGPAKALEGVLSGRVDLSAIEPADVEFAERANRLWVFSAA